MEIWGRANHLLFSEKGWSDEGMGNDLFFLLKKQSEGEELELHFSKNKKEAESCLTILGFKNLK